MTRNYFLFGVLVILFSKTTAQNFITENKETGSFSVVSNNTATIFTDENDDWLIQKTATLFQNDIEKITGKKPAILHTLASSGKNIIIIGSIHSSFIHQLIKENKINTDSLKGKWEAYQIQIIDKPFKGIDNALVIAGSDKRGTAYGVFELTKQMGVSPWYWWADVPVKKKKELYVKKTTFQFDLPSVKYRGIFINDEAPAFSGWAKEKFDGVNHNVYETIFELLLRLKANYLWPAMWNNAFNDDDTLNPILADKWGIVMGTSHHEPMLRAQQEWKRFGKGQWNYDSNEVLLKQFWKKGIENMGSHESIVTIGMRGDGDKPMAQGTAITLLERIVADQRKVIADVTGKPAASTPQLWALYKEVQDYYDQGMRVPEDVTLLLCDDNWGNIRKLPNLPARGPDLTDKPRSGGYGIYYHFDYVGGPRNYKWINTNNIARVWEQMHLAYEYGVDKIWIANVGDLKPMEFPISFFLDYAWNTTKWNEDNLRNYYTEWATQQFGTTYAKEIGDIIRKYSQYNARRKPELLSPETYSLFNYNEADNVVNDDNKLVADAEKINQLLPAEYKDAFFELVLHPVKASANLNEMYVTAGWNKYYVPQRLAIANEYADKAKQLYNNDSLITLQYHDLGNGKWNHMMDQTHIGYTYWQQPSVNKMPGLKYLSQDSITEPEPAIDTAVSTAEYLISAKKKGNVFYEFDGYVSIEAEHFTKAISTSNIHWKIIPDIGRDGSGITTFPVMPSIQSLNVNSPHVVYELFVYDSGKIAVNAFFSPTLNFHNDEGLKYGISIDDEQPQIISINKDDNNTKTWEGWVANNIIIKNSNHSISKPGKHVLKYWMVSPAVVLQKIILDFGGVKQSYLGPPETKIK
jgi:Glycosyl hydrolase family 115/Gylcosyl hydrolase family 115 C-terminal domain